MAEDTTTPLTAEEEAAIRERCEKATPGPWADAGLGHWPERAGVVTLRWQSATILCGDDYLSGPNAAFIAHARTDIPRLLAELDRLRTENARLRASQH